MFLFSLSLQTSTQAKTNDQRGKGTVNKTLLHFQIEWPRFGHVIPHQRSQIGCLHRPRWCHVPLYRRPVTGTSHRLSPTRLQATRGRTLSDGPSVPLNTAVLAIIVLRASRAGRTENPRNSPDPLRAGQGNWGQLMTNNFVRSRPELLALARSAHGRKNTCHHTMPERMNAHPWWRSLQKQSPHRLLTTSLRVGATKDRQ